MSNISGLPENNQWMPGVKSPRQAKLNLGTTDYKTDNIGQKSLNNPFSPSKSIGRMKRFAFKFLNKQKNKSYTKKADSFSKTFFAFSKQTKKTGKASVISGNIEVDFQELKEVPAKKEPVNIEEETQAIMKHLPTLESKDAEEVNELIQAAIKDIEENKGEWIAKAKAEEGIYIRGEKSPEDLKGKEAKYTSAHIQVNADGKIFIIPKHPKLHLGKGTFKRVRTAIEYEPGGESKLVASASAKMINDNAIDEAKNEIELAKKLNNEKGFSYIVYSGRKMKAMMPYANMGDLKDFKTKDPQQKKEIMKQCLLWIQKMHLEGFTHADIKPENFLLNIDKNGEIEIFIMDLGTSSKGIESQEPKGSPLFMAPETFQGPHNGHQADIFSLGVALFQIMEGKSPDCIDNSMVQFGRMHMRDEDKYHEEWKKFSPSPENKFEQLIKEMIHPDPKKRPVFDEEGEFLKRFEAALK